MLSEGFRIGFGPDIWPQVTLRRLTTSSRHQYGVTLTQTSIGVAEHGNIPIVRPDSTQPVAAHPYGHANSQRQQRWS